MLQVIRSLRLHHHDHPNGAGREEPQATTPPGPDPTENSDTEPPPQTNKMAEPPDEETVPCKKTTSQAGRSVKDFATADDLRDALMSSDATTTTTNAYCHGDSTAWMFAKNERALKELLRMDASSDPSCAAQKDNTATITSCPMDWILNNYDESTSHPQSTETELRRLLVLRSFLLLDDVRHNSMQASFDGITALAQQTFDTPYCLISLVDLGRQWFLSKQGRLDAHETPRNISFCTHCIQTKLDVLEVTDATNDQRFCDNPLVTGAPGIRYYAGVPLVSPEGYRVGTLCVIDVNTRPAMSDQDRAIMKEMAALVVDTMVQHRQRMSLWFQNLVSARAPRLVLQDESDGGGDDETNDSVAQERPPEPRTDDDQDFEALLRATQTMSLEELVQVLQAGDGDEQENEDAASFRDEDHGTSKRPRSVSPPRILPTPLLENHGSDDRSHPVVVVPESANRRPTKRQSRGAKHFCIVEEANQVFEVDSWKDMEELWWSPDDMHNVRLEQIDIVKYYRKHHKQYTNVVRNVMKSSPRRAAEGCLDNSCSALRNLKGFVYARGLEGHIVDFLSKAGQELRRAVLQEQWQCLEELQEEDDMDIVMDALRDRSLIYSQFAACFSECLARIDEVESLFGQADGTMETSDRSVDRGKLYSAAA